MLELTAIEARYGAATALRDVSLSIGTGELVCVVACVTGQSPWRVAE